VWTALDDALGQIAARWIDLLRPRARGVAVACVLVGLAALAYTAETLGLNSNEDDLFSAELPFVGLRRDFYRAFPSLVDPVVVVVDADTRDLVDEATDRLAQRLRDDPDHFVSVYEPGGGPFFEQNGLLYWSVDELYDLTDNLAAAQPYLAELSLDPSLRGLSSLLAGAIEAVDNEDFPEADLAEVLRRVGDGVEAAVGGRRYSLSWADLILGKEATRKERRRFLVVEPIVDFEQVNPAEGTLLQLRSVIQDLGFAGSDGVRARVTGLFALAYEELEHVSQQTSLAGVAAFVLVALVLFLGLGSARFVFAALVTLLVGLTWTAAFAALAVGYLNLISVAFAVLFIGLSIDFAIHVCVRYREFLALGQAPADAIREAVRRVGGALAVCAGTTAIGFYAFVPTDYAGVGELGLIAGTGMLISLFTNLTLLPCLLLLWTGPSPPPARAQFPAWLDALLGVPVRHPRLVAAAGLVLAVGAALLCAKLRFDPNPLRMRDPSAQSVQAFNDMLRDGEAFPWNVNVMATDSARADAMASRLAALEQVDYTVTLSDYLPGNQETKLAILEDAALLLGPAIDQQPTEPTPTSAQQAEALGELRSALARLDRSNVSAGFAEATERLGTALEAFLVEADAGALDRLEGSLLGSLPERLRLLRASLRAEPVELGDLPPEVTERLVGTDGRIRVEVFPKGDLSDNRDLEAYVESVRALAPAAFGEGVAILESGRAVVTALREALVVASVLIFLMILALWRTFSGAALVAIPLGLAALFTGALAEALGIPLNFANVIVIPLLFGMGVDSAIHLVHRSRAGGVPGGNVLQTSTARAVLFSSLTTIASFGTLGLSTHPGMASLGRLLTVGIAMTLVCSLVILPALLTLLGAGRSRPS
jgi:hopanoid biosynthesis associated RND transporter like protein HpnN